MSTPRKDRLLNLSPYSGYLYAYPHKTAYRTFDTPLDLETVWKSEKQDALFLYAHIPFCEMRCGFCNLFTMTGAKDDAVNAYMTAMARQAQTLRAALPKARFAEIAIGGGTPTFLEAKQLARLFQIVTDLTDGNLPLSIETSPSRTTPERLRIMQEHTVSRISIGIESFSDFFLRAMGRPARTSDAITALDHIRAKSDAALNIDLIYGAQGQSCADVQADVRQALQWEPEEVFIYPLYIRPLTGLSKKGRSQNMDWDAQRLDHYRAARDQLLTAGYRQYSMRRFVKSARLSTPSYYSCQEDGMIGLGAGARSYTQNIHYASEYAVGRQAIQSIIAAYSAAEDFAKIHYGIKLSEVEARRRYVIKSILNVDGLDLAAYEARFGSSVLADIAEISELIKHQYLEQTPTHLRPTSLGLERSDAMGPFLISSDVADIMQAYAWS